MTGALAAVEFEALKFRRAPVVRTTTVLVGLGVPGLAAAFMLAATSGDSLLSLKIRALISGTGWTAYLGMVGQLFSVTVLLGVGVVICWSFGREFTDDTLASLFALPVPRQHIADAKVAVVLGWSLALTAGSIVVSLVLGLAMGLGMPDGSGLRVLAMAGTAAVLTALLACPLAFVASALRGYLGGIGALILLIVCIQLITFFGAGAWFPYAAPGLWLGMGGPEAATEVTPVQLSLTLPVAAAGIIATREWWRRAQLV